MSTQSDRDLRIVLPIALVMIALLAVTLLWTFWPSIMFDPVQYEQYKEFLRRCDGPDPSKDCR